MTPEEMTKDFLDKSCDEKELSFYSGRVVNNNDPDQQGKCQIRVYCVFGDEIPDEDLPWALPDFGFIGSTLGSFIVPPNGAIVKVYFDQGDLYLPHYTTKAVNAGSLPPQRFTDYPDTMVFFSLDEEDYLTINRKTGDAVYSQRLGVKIVADEDGNLTIHSDVGVKIDTKVSGDNQTVIGPDGGYVVTSPSPGPILTQDGHTLQATEKVRA